MSPNGGVVIGGRSRLAAAGLALALTGCPSPVDDPAEAYRLFSQAALTGDEAAAWERISEGSRARLTAAARAVAAAEGRPAPADGRTLLLAHGLGSASRLASATVKSTEGDTAIVVAIDASGGRREVPMRREQGGWRVDLVPMLDAAVAKSAVDPGC